MLNTMRAEGYHQREGADYPDAMVSRNGEIIKTLHGTHRFAAALATGSEAPFPLRIVGVHRKWWQSRRGAGYPRSRAGLSSALRQLEKSYCDPWPAAQPGRAYTGTGAPH